MKSAKHDIADCICFMYSGLALSSEYMLANRSVGISLFYWSLPKITRAPTWLREHIVIVIGENI